MRVECIYLILLTADVSCFVCFALAKPKMRPIIIPDVSVIESIMPRELSRGLPTISSNFSLMSLALVNVLNIFLDAFVDLIPSVISLNW